MLETLGGWEMRCLGFHDRPCEQGIFPRLYNLPHIGSDVVAFPSFRIQTRTSAAALGALYTERLQSTLIERLGPGEGARIAADRLTAETLRNYPAAAREAVHFAVSSGVHVVAVTAAVFGVAAFALAWFIREVPLRDRTPADTAV
nr:hypothetical protein [Sinosporangium siamense]